MVDIGKRERKGEAVMGKQEWWKEGEGDGIDTGMLW